MVDVPTRHGWTAGNQLVHAFQAQGVEAQITGHAQAVTHTVVTTVSAVGGLAAPAGRVAPTRAAAWTAWSQSWLQ